MRPEQQMRAGARLSHVVMPLEGEVEREVTRFSKDKGLHKEMETQPAGFLVFFPRGHVMRLKTMAELEHYGLDRDPLFMDLKGLYDPNTAVGKLFSSQDENERAESYRHLEAQVIALATKNCGRGNIMPEQISGELKLDFPQGPEQGKKESGAPTMLRQHTMRGGKRKPAAE